MEDAAAAGSGFHPGCEEGGGGGGGMRGGGGPEVTFRMGFSVVDYRGVSIKAILLMVATIFFYFSVKV